MFYIKDHPLHGVPILGGMWGYANYRNREVGKGLMSFLKNKEIAYKYNKDHKNQKGKDQDFLSDYFWPTVKINAVIQDSYLCHTLGGSPFPTERPKNYCFVPCAYCCDDKYKQKWEYEGCPKECRPINHQNWTYC